MTEARFSFTCKIAGDLFTVRGDTLAEFVANLNGAVDAVGNAQNLQAVSTAIGGLGGGTVVSQQVAPAVAPFDPAPPAPQQAPQVTQGGVPTPTCAHGARVYREAKPGSGKNWKAWFCPTPQGTADQCKPEFL